VDDLVPMVVVMVVIAVLRVFGIVRLADMSVAFCLEK